MGGCWRTPSTCSGDERFTLLVKDLQTGELLRGRIRDTAYGAAWARTATSSTPGPTRPGGRTSVLRHRLGSDPASRRRGLHASLTSGSGSGWTASRDEEWVIIGAGSKLTSEYRLLSTADPEGEPRVVAPRRQGVEYDVEPAGDRLLIMHNDGAEDFALAEAPLDATDPGPVDPVLPHQPGVRILACERVRQPRRASRSAATGSAGCT